MVRLLVMKQIGSIQAEACWVSLNNKSCSLRESEKSKPSVTWRGGGGSFKPPKMPSWYNGLALTSEHDKDFALIPEWTHTHWYRISGYFRGVYISQILKLLQSVELIIKKLTETENHTSWVQFLQKIFILWNEILEICTPQNKPL